MRILICGATYFTNYNLFHDKILEIIYEKDYNRFPIEIISGMAKGADTMAVVFAHQYDLPLHEFPANWDKYSKGAGPIRNQQMIDEGKPDLIIAFPMKSSKGTRDMINRGLLHDIETIVVEV